MKNLISGTLSVLMLSAVAVPAVQAQVQRPGMPGGTDQGIPGVTNQSQPGVVDSNESNVNVPGAPGSGTVDADRFNTPGSSTTPNPTIPGSAQVNPGDTFSPGVQRPGMPGGTDQGIPGVTNQSQPGVVDSNESNVNVPGAPGSLPSTTPGQLGQPGQPAVPGNFNQPGASVTTPSPLASEVTPFNLVNLARNGYFREEGIPSGGALASSARAGVITADDIIEAAAAQGRVNANVSEDTGYRNALALHLYRLQDNGGR